MNGLGIFPTATQFSPEIHSNLIESFKLKCIAVQPTHQVFCCTSFTVVCVHLELLHLCVELVSICVLADHEIQLNGLM